MCSTLKIYLLVYLVRKVSEKSCNSLFFPSFLHDFVRKNLKFIIPVQLALGVLGLELFGILVFGHATLIELLGLFST